MLPPHSVPWGTVHTPPFMLPNQSGQIPASPPPPELKELPSQPFQKVVQVSPGMRAHGLVPGPVPPLPRTHGVMVPGVQPAPWYAVQTVVPEVLDVEPEVLDVEPVVTEVTPPEPPLPPPPPLLLQAATAARSKEATRIEVRFMSDS